MNAHSVVTLVVAAMTLLRAPMRTPPTRGPARTPAADSTSVRASMSKRIDAFELQWQTAWKQRQQETQLQNSLTMGGRNDPFTRRMTALSCHSAAAARLAVPRAQSLVLRRPVVTSPDRGSVCPLWLAPGEAIPGDESESIDLALSLDQTREIRRARDGLLRDLAGALRSVPGDWWISGQRVRFLIDQQQFAEAIAAAAECRGDMEFCAALSGLAYFTAKRTVDADSAFHVADSLEAARDIAAGARCLRTDALALLENPDHPLISDERCAKSRTLVDHLWWLADPLWSVAGNERFVAHHARRIHTDLRDDDENDERYVWSVYAAGSSLRQTVLRYGWPSHTYWPGWQTETQAEDAMMKYATNASATYGRIGVIRGKGGPRNVRLTRYPLSVKEYSTDRIALVPSFDMVKDPFSIRESDWKPYNPEPEEPDGWWPREHMALPLRLMPLPDGQGVVWRRDSTNVFALATDDPLRNFVATGMDSLVAVLIGGDSPATTAPLANTMVTSGSTMRLRADLSSRPLVFGVEIVVPVAPAAALRARAGLRPPPTLGEMSRGEIAVSAPVFVRLPARGTQPPTDPAQAEQWMAGNLTFRRDAPIALYWESYGITPGDTVQLTVTIRRDEDRSVLRAAAAAAGVASDLRDSVSIRWSEPDARGRTVLATRVPTVGRGITLDMAQLPPGQYIASIEMQRGALIARGTRTFWLMP